MASFHDSSRVSRERRTSQNCPPKSTHRHTAFHTAGSVLCRANAKKWFKFFLNKNKDLILKIAHLFSITKDT